MNEKVYCKECVHYKQIALDNLCYHKDSLIYFDTYLERASKYKYCSELNRRNSCKNFKKLSEER